MRNNRKKDDLIVALAYPEKNWEACRVSEIFLDCTHFELPFSFDKWRRTVQAPVELYFVFERKKQLMQFVKQTRKEMPNMKIVFEGGNLP